jgi:26S proteasome regulatory subunit N6
MIKLAELHRDQRCVLTRSSFPSLTWRRNAKGLAEVITLSRSFMSSTAKAKTAKLSKLYTVSCWRDSMIQLLTKDV